MAREDAGFFDRRQPAAVLKHSILEKYLPVFVRKAGSRSWKRRVAYVDGYAGPGSYEDGSPGSPALAIEAAEIVSQGNGSRQIDGYLVEEDPLSAQALQEHLSRRELSWPVYEGDVNEHLPAILSSLPPTQASFFLLDPFGLGVPLSLIQRIKERGGTMRSGHRASNKAATEVLLNFSTPGLRRNAGHLTSTSDYGPYIAKARPTLIGRANDSLGGTWWHDIWAGGQSDREDVIRNEYLNRLKSSGWFAWDIPVSDRWMAAPDYYLIFLTQHLDGIWEFHQAVSSAMEAYRTVCLEGQLDFEPVEVRDARWTEAIQNNIRDLLRAEGAFEVQRKMRSVYGSTLTFAREKHVRAAIKALYAAGETSTTGVGTVQTMIVKPAP